MGHPDCIAAQHKLAVMYTQGDHYGLRSEPVKGIQAWENVYKLDPEHRTALNELGKAYKRAGKIKRALELYRAANKLDEGYDWWCRERCTVTWMRLRTS